MPAEIHNPVNRRIGFKVMRPAGGGTEFLTVMLIDYDDEDRHNAKGTCES